MRSSFTRMTLLLLGIYLSVAFIQIVTRTVSLLGLSAWFIAVIIVCVSQKNSSPSEPIFPLDKKDITLILICCGILLGLYSLINQLPDHYHRDEFILAYTSYTLPAIGKIDWFKGYPDDWLAQFPILFFILQKPFFTLFGPTINAMRISVYPYSILIVFYLYALVKLIVSRRFAILTTVLYITLACIIYFNTLAVHNICSALFLLASMYHFLGLCRGKNGKHVVLLGIFLALSYLTYTGSYIVLPVVVICSFVHWRKTKSRLFIHQCLSSLFICFIILFPFLIHALFVHNYFLDRFMTVNIFTGTRSDFSEQLQHGTSVGSLVTSNIVQSLLALVIPGIGGTDGYYFGNRALFDSITSFFLFLGFWTLCVQSFIKKQIPSLCIFVTVILAALVGYIFAIQPPAFHRLSVIFPFLPIILAFGILRLSGFMSRGYHKFKLAIVCVCCAVLIISNFLHLQDMLIYDYQDYPYSVELAQQIQRVIPKHSTITIGAYWGFHMGKELLFRTRNQYNFVTDDEETILQNYIGGPLLFIDPTDNDIQVLSFLYPNYALKIYDNSIAESMAFFYPRPKQQQNDGIISP